jgi:hypothetical protein
MNIVWGIERTLKPACGSTPVKVEPNDQWQEVKVKGPNVRPYRGIETSDITKGKQVFRNIPTNWFLIEN